MILDVYPKRDSNYGFYEVNPGSISSKASVLASTVLLFIY